MSSRALIELTGISKGHQGRAALSDVSLTIPAGAFVAVVGPSGSGKTTLLKAINLLGPPDAGVVRIDGEDARAVPIAVLRRRIGYVFQGIGLFPHLDVAENIWIVPRLAGADPAARDVRIAELLDLVALPFDLAARLPRALSGGQAQRVGVARALAARPSIMLMDEPFGALDPIARDELGRAYRALHERLGLTTLMVTHDITEAILLADRIVVLIDGRICADATPASLLAGHSDEAVRALVAVPRRQAERLAAMAAAP